jgi:hypothetical protein
MREESTIHMTQHAHPEVRLAAHTFEVAGENEKYWRWQFEEAQVELARLRADLAAALAQLAEKDGQVCRAREAMSISIDALKEREHAEGDGLISLLGTALSSSSPCRHAKEAERWEAAWRKEQEVATLAEGHAFDASYKAAELIVENKRLWEALRGIVQWADPCWTGGYAGDPKTPHPAWGDVQEGRAALEAAKP